MKEKVKALIERIKDDFNSSLISIDVWQEKTGLSLGEYNSNKEMTHMLYKMLKTLKDNLASLGLPDFVLANTA
jgi:hypothetical protein